MADKQKTVEIIFGGVDRTGQAVQSVGRNLDSLQDRVGGITGPLSSATDMIAKLDTALAALAAAAAAFATKEAVEFEAALTDLQKVMGDSEGQASDYADEFTNLASRFGVGLDSIVGSVADFRQAGYDIDESLTLVEQSLLGVNAADLTTVQSSELLIGTLAGFNAPASEAAHLLDVLNGVSNKAGASVKELGDGFKILSPVAETLGLTFEETAALLTPMVEVTRSGSESANALKTAISNLIDPTKKQQELLENELGIQLELNGERRDTKDVLYELIDVTQDLTKNEKQRVASVIAGAEQMSRFLAILNGAERSEEVLNTALNSSGSAMEEFETKTESAKFAMKQLQSAFNAAAATAGVEYIDQTKQVTQATTNLVDSFRTAIQGDNANVLFEALRNGLESFAEQVNVVAENLLEAFEGLDFSDLLQSFEGLGDEVEGALTALFGDIDLSTVQGLEDALQKVVDTLTALVNVSGGIISGLEPLFAGIGKGVEEFQDLDAATQKSVGELLGLSKAIDTVLPAISSLAGGLSSIGTGLTALAGAQGFKAIAGNLENIKKIGKTGLGKGGLIGVALTGGFAIGEVINDLVIEPMEDAFGTSIGAWLYEQFNADEIEKIKKQMKPLTDAQKELREETSDLRDMNTRLADSLDNTKQAARLDIDALNKRAQELVNNANAQGALNEELDEYTGQQRDTTTAVEDLNQRMSDSRGALGDVGEATRNLAENNKTLVVGYDKASGKINSWTGKVIENTGAMDDNAEKTKKVITESENFRIQMEKLQSNERIKTVEAEVRLDIAEVEANAEKVKALAETIGTAFSETTGSISDLFGDLSDASGLKEMAIEKQIRKENELREEAFELQKKLTKAQIEQIKERTRAIRQGDSLIEIDGAGLQPHLEAFMFEILREIQVRVSAEGGEMLLGLSE
ncbi:phage tail tape measure protein [Tamilnaduibacter salinus]|uniref:Phage tail tape measure protein n=1 Tax=Tamilnaduibacter salinus TaxID=1484056 RepID=A0A2A2I283_9GAMM|nr:phage tail tape measure protein [Tamilnaduibacter salinus]PAV25200.1 phage tail tape measure protein [Tamilnaduibacter salinus]